MKKSLKKVSLTENYKGHTILVYGELWEEGYVDGIVIRRAKFSKDGKKVMDESITSEDILLNRPYTRTRYFNMGWAICSPNDKFDEKIGIELCKRRFRKSPLKTETGLFLTKDMVEALLVNEVEYIKKHWNKFVHNEPNAFIKVAKKFNNTIIKTAQKQEEILEQPKEILPKISAGDYVRIFNPLKKGWPETVGYVESVDDNNVYLVWVMKYGEHEGSNYASFTYRSGVKPVQWQKENVRIATTEEISNALKHIEENTRFHWNISTKQLKLKF